MRYFVFFGATGWWAKFIEIFEYVKSLDKKFQLKGIIIGLSIEEKIKKDYPYFNYDCDQRDTLVNNFLSNTYDKKVLYRIEKKYGNLWKYINAERRFVYHFYWRRFQRKEYSHHELIKIIAGQFLYFEKVLSNVDVIVTNPPASSWAMTMCAVAKKKGIKIINIDQVVFPSDRATFTFSPKQIWTDAEEVYEKNKKSKIFDKVDYNSAKELLLNWRKKPSPAAWLSLTDHQGNLNKWMSFEKISRFVSRLKDKFKGKEVNVPDPILQIKQFAKFKITRFLVNHIISLEKKFDTIDFYYPLHVEPEASLMISGIRAMDQMALIKRIASQLPVGKLLYVKDHPTMVGWRSISAYKDLKKIPNIRVLHPNINSKFVLKKSNCIFTVCGSSGWEALMFKKPVLLIGDAFYRKLPMVNYIDNLDDISSNLDWLNKKYKYSERDLIFFICSVIRSSIKVPFEYFWGISDEKNTKYKLQNYKNISKNIASQIFKKSSK